MVTRDYTNIRTLKGDKQVHVYRVDTDHAAERYRAYVRNNPGLEAFGMTREKALDNLINEVNRS